MEHQKKQLQNSDKTSTNQFSLQLEKLIEQEYFSIDGCNVNGLVLLRVQV